MKKYITILLIFLLSVPLVFADDLNPFENEEKQPIVKIIYQGYIDRQPLGKAVLYER